MVGAPRFEFHLTRALAIGTSRRVRSWSIERTLAPDLADQREQFLQLARTVVQVRSRGASSGPLAQAVADNPVEQVDIDIAAADANDHALATQLRLELETRRERSGTGAFGKQFHPLEHQQDRLANLEIVDGDGAMNVRMNEFERQPSDASGGEAVGDSIDRTD